MSKAEATSGQSLEEILASIRKSLADDKPAAESTAAAPEEPRSEPRPAPAEIAPKPKDALPNWVTGTPRSDGKSAARRDEDLDDLFETGPKSAAPAGVSGAGETSPRPGEGRDSDPLWFLSRRQDAPATDAGAKVAQPEPAKEPATGSKGEPERNDPTKSDPGNADPSKSDSALRRLEGLRATLPPFFGARVDAPPSDATPATDRVKSADLGFLWGRQQDAVVPPAQPAARAGNVTAAPVPAPAEPVPPKPAPAPAAATEPAQPLPTKPAAIALPAEAKADTEIKPEAIKPEAPVAGTAAAAPAAVAEQPTATETVTASTPASSQPPRAAPASVGGEAMAASSSTETASAKATDVVAAGPAQPPQAHALEGMVMEMLQPMLRDWCDKNLPRLVQTALNDEVARAVKGTRDAGKT